MLQNSGGSCSYEIKISYNIIFSAHLLRVISTLKDGEKQETGNSVIFGHSQKTSYKDKISNPPLFHIKTLFSKYVFTKWYLNWKHYFL